MNQYLLRNQLFLNINKCKVMSFHRKRSPVLFDYNIHNESLGRVYELKDLGVIFDPSFRFVRHIDFIVNKAYSMLGFIMRICADFTAASVFLSLYFAYVRSHLEYAAAIWNPNYDVHVQRIESVQKSFYSF